MKTSYKLFILLLFLSTTALHSQVARDRLEKNNNRYEIITAKQQVKRDMREIESFRDLVQDFKLYYLSEDVDQVNEVRAKLIADMDREIRQNTAKASAGKREVKRSSKEVENSEKDLRETMEKSSGVSRRIWFLADRETRAERKDHADDIRDLADDENDVVNRKKRVDEQEMLLSKFKTMTVMQTDITNIESMPEVRLLERFMGTMQEDLKETQLELSEDRIEMREDKKELREDRRDRRDDRRERRAY